MSPRRARGLTATALAGSWALLAITAAAPAGAGWPTTVHAASGPLTAAVTAHDFRVVGAVGTGGSTYTASVAIGTTVGHVDLVSTSTVPVTLRGTVSLSSFLSTQVTITSCSQPWSAGACPGTSAVLMAITLSAQADVAWHPGAVGVGEAVHLQVKVDGSVSNQVTLTATAQAARGPQDRTAG